MAAVEYETIKFSSMKEALDWLDQYLTPPASNVRLYKYFTSNGGVCHHWWRPKDE